MGLYILTIEVLAAIFLQFYLLRRYARTSSPW